MAALASTRADIATTRPATGPLLLPRLPINSRTTKGNAKPVAAVARLNTPPTASAPRCGAAYASNTRHAGTSVGTGADPTVDPGTLGGSDPGAAGSLTHGPPPHHQHVTPVDD